MKTPLFVSAFLTVLIVAEAGVRMLAPQLPVPEAWPSYETEIKAAQVEQLQRESLDVDVALFGSSVTEAAVDPEIWMNQGVTAYNAAIPYGTLLALEPWIGQIVVPALEPEVVVIGVSLWYPNPNPEDDPLRSPLQEIAAARRRSGGWEWPWDHSELWARRAQLKAPFTAIQQAELAKVPLWSRFGHQVGYADEKIVAHKLEKRELNGDPTHNLEALARTISALRRHEVEVVVIIEPAQCPVDLYECDRASMEGYAADLRSAAQRAGAAFLDTRRFRAASEMFADPVHFNREGTVAYSEFLLGELLRIGVLDAGLEGPGAMVVDGTGI